MDLAERARRLEEELIAPLLVGGAIRLQRPFGPKLVLAIGIERSIVDPDRAALIDAARLRRARAVVAVDALAPLDRWEWAIAAALNDLLQTTNHELSGFATRDRHASLCHSVIETCAAIAPPRTLEEGLARHATFARMLELARVDTRVEWWTGSASFRGTPVPERLLAWPDLRQVSVASAPVPLAAMAAGSALDPARFHQALAALLGTSPLTDLAGAAREAPRFVWTSGTLALASTVAGRNLVLRALARTTTHEPALVAIAAATAALPAGGLAEIARGFYAELHQAAPFFAPRSEREPQHA